MDDGGRSQTRGREGSEKWAGDTKERRADDGGRSRGRR